LLIVILLVQLDDEYLEYHDEYVLLAPDNSKKRTLMNI
jgi:hypothetical protein